MSIALNDFVRNGKYTCSRTIVLFEFVYLAFEITLKIENICDRRAAPCVYTLILVAYRKNVSVSTREYLYNIVLDNVGVLELVDMYISEFVLIKLASFGVRFEQSQRFYEQIVVIERIVRAQRILVRLIRFAYFVGILCEFINFGIIARRYALIFGFRYFAQNKLLQVLGQIRFFAYTLYDGFCFGIAVDSKIFAVPDLIDKPS